MGLRKNTSKLLTWGYIYIFLHRDILLLNLLTGTRPTSTLTPEPVTESINEHLPVHAPVPGSSNALKT